MRPSRNLGGGSEVWARQYVIGATVVHGQVVCKDANVYGVAGAPASVNDYTEALGVVTGAGATYAAAQATAPARTAVALAALATFRGKCSGGTAADTAFAAATDGNLLTQGTAETAGTTVTDANVGTSEFVGGFLVGLTGANAGKYRVITTHTDNTSTVVTLPFTGDIAAGDTFIRTFGEALQGLELTTNFVQFNMKPGAGVDLPDTGHGCVVAVYVDDSELLDPNFVNLRNPSDPQVEVEIVFIDHAFNSVA